MSAVCLAPQVSCGSAHTLALTNKGTVFSWGAGGGGRLGHGDVRDRYSPSLIESLATTSVVTQVSAGFWHSAALVHAPPLAVGRMVGSRAAGGWWGRSRREGSRGLLTHGSGGLWLGFMC